MMPQSKIECFINKTKKYVIYRLDTAFLFIKVTISGTPCSSESQQGYLEVVFPKGEFTCQLVKFIANFFVLSTCKFCHIIVPQINLLQKSPCTKKAERQCITYFIITEDTI